MEKSLQNARLLLANLYDRKLKHCNFILIYLFKSSLFLQMRERLMNYHVSMSVFFSSEFLILMNFLGTERDENRI